MIWLQLCYHTLDRRRGSSKLLYLSVVDLVLLYIYIPWGYCLGEVMEENVRRAILAIRCHRKRDGPLLVVV